MTAHCCHSFDTTNPDTHTKRGAISYLPSCTELQTRLIESIGCLPISSFLISRNTSMFLKKVFFTLTTIILGSQLQVMQILACKPQHANNVKNSNTKGTKPYVRSKQPFRRLPLDQLPPLEVTKNPDADLLLRAISKHETTSRVPIWCMRQAGRHLPEFRALSAQGYDFFTMCQIPELAVEISLQPLRRYGVDAVIIFSDILVIPQAMGMHIDMLKGKGPVFSNPLRTPKDIQSQGLNLNPDIDQELGYVLDAINLARQEIDGKVPLIGFCGGPLSLLMFMVEGQSSKTMTRLKTWLYKYPRETHEILQSLTDICGDFLIAQYEAGAQVLQVFESVGAEGLTQDHYYEFVLPYLAQIADRVKRFLPEECKIPLIVFSKGTDYALERLASETKYDCLGLDWASDPSNVRSRIGADIALQGNMDPCCIFAEKETIELEVDKMLNGFGKQNYVANFGHGCFPDMDPDQVDAFIKAVQQKSLTVNI